MQFKRREYDEPLRIVFDLETLDTANSAVVLSLGIVPFRLSEKKNFQELVDGGVNILFDVEIQKQMGCTVSDDTLAWWEQQGEGAREVLSGGHRHNPADLHKLIYDAIDRIPPKTRWYARGLHFDMAIMNHLCKRFKIREPWGYQDGRDLRTWFDFYKSYERELWRNEQEGFIAHNSLHDSALEALHMQQCFQLQLEADQMTLQATHK